MPTGDEGLWLRGMTLFIPPKMAYLGTLFAVSVVQDEVVPVDGKPEIRPMLPLSFVFDHRIMDGVLAGSVVARFGEILHQPETVFGARGHNV